MRLLTISIILFCCTSLFAQKWSGKGQHQPATEAYLSRVGTIIFNRLAPEMAKHPERLSGALKLALQIDPQGHIQVQKVVSTTSNLWLRDTALRVIHAVKLPPMPKEVGAEQGHAPVDFEAEWSFELHH